jgi:hypothetical protein
MQGGPLIAVSVQLIVDGHVFQGFRFQTYRQGSVGGYLPSPKSYEARPRTGKRPPGQASCTLFSPMCTASSETESEHFRLLLALCRK